MLSFLSSFTQSFLLAVLVWPFLAILLTVPILVVQYRRDGRVSVGRGIVAYLAILYALGLVSFTLYPMPDDPVAFCRDYLLSPQLTPLQFTQDIRTDGSSALLQVVMNFVFFVPLGVFGRLFFGWRLRTTALVSFVVSLGIETAQLTGGFGYYPCSYRLFDIDDLLINTLGGIGGYLLALLLPRREIEQASAHEFVRRAGLVRYTVALLLDQCLSYSVAIVGLLVIYFAIGKDEAIAVREVAVFATTCIIINVVPWLTKGWSLGGWVVRLNHDDRVRKPVRRFVFYATRAVVLMLLLFPPYNITAISFGVIAILLVVWWRHKKLLYQFV